MYSTLSLAYFIANSTSSPAKPCLILMCLLKASHLEKDFLALPPLNWLQTIHLKIFFDGACKVSWCLIKSYGLENTLRHGFFVTGLISWHWCDSSALEKDLEIEEVRDFFSTLLPELLIV
ncbi:hypothetical protein WICPIJ_004131 [Wickerhamomyces pijperi]|uniref:Uncharacterized protein n=1 Tax=Wickerhamomyces pijperi TaxID=599730 RepID=A0A9P8TMB8_WICPI|nr:hypothetical protein WICPIJ_004131 [Wickerhamomyces pijperi]